MNNQILWLIVTQIITLIIQFYIATTEKIKHIFIVTLLFNVFNMLCYLLNNDLATVYLYIVICIRSFIYVYRDKIKIYKWHHIIPILACIAQIYVGFTSINNIWQIIPIILPCYNNYYLWYYTSTQKLRVWNIVNNLGWGVYNAVSSVYIIALGRIITVIMNISAYYKHSKDCVGSSEKDTKIK